MIVYRTPLSVLKSLAVALLSRLSIIALMISRAVELAPCWPTRFGIASQELE